MTQGITDIVQIETASGSLPAHRWLPEGGHGPGLVVFQEIFGVSAYIRDRAADLAALGYVVIAPEFYWRLDDAELEESGPDFLQRAMGIVSRLDWEAAVEDGRAAVQRLRTMPEVTGGIGLIGFCFGGGLAFNVAAGLEVGALVSYYGSALPNLLGLADRVSVPTLHHFGLDDTYIDRNMVETIRLAVQRPGVVFETYAGAGHAFDNPHPDFHHADASARAWDVTTAFLTEHVPA
jgi:carboxymethylenebutenolidase